MLVLCLEHNNIAVALQLQPRPKHSCKTHQNPNVKTLPSVAQKRSELIHHHHASLDHHQVGREERLRPHTAVRLTGTMSLYTVHLEDKIGCFQIDDIMTKYQLWARNSREIKLSVMARGVRLLFFCSCGGWDNFEVPFRASICTQ